MYVIEAMLRPGEKGWIYEKEGEIYWTGDYNKAKKYPKELDAKVDKTRIADHHHPEIVEVE